MSHRQVWCRWRQLQQWWQSPNFFSVTCCGESFPSILVQGVEGLILVGALFLLDGGKKKKSTWWRRVSPGRDPPCWLCSWLQLLGAIKGWFVGLSLNFFLHLVWWRLLFWLEAVRITQVWLQLLREVLESPRLGFLLLYLSCHLGKSSQICFAANFFSLLLNSN
jgi:hypothetical protein